MLRVDFRADPAGRGMLGLALREALVRRVALEDSAEVTAALLTFSRCLAVCRRYRFQS